MREISLLNRINQMSDSEVLARTIYGEARGECGPTKIEFQENLLNFKGLVAIGNVAHNRLMQQTWYGQTIKKVCLKPYQFSCWNEGDPNLEKLLNVTDKSEIYQICCKISHAILNNELIDVTLGADHYHSASLKHLPSWVSFAKETIKIGNHRFYKMKICY